MESKTRADYEKGRRRTERTRLSHTHESKVNEVPRPTEKKTPKKTQTNTQKTHQQQNLKELESWELEPDRAAGQ